MQAYYGEDRTRGLPSAGHDSERTTRMPSEWHLCGGPRRGSTVDPVCARLHDRQYCFGWWLTFSEGSTQTPHGSLNSV